MRFRATSFFAPSAIVAAVSATAPGRADEPPTAQQAKLEGHAPHAKQEEPASETPR